MSAGSVVGLDLSLTSTGVAVAGQGRIHYTAAIRTAGKKGDLLPSRAERLGRIVKQVYAEVSVNYPELVVIEAPSYGSTMGSQHDRSGLWWLVVDMLLGNGFPVATVSPNGRAKYGTGRGNAGKDEVLASVVKRYSRDGLEIKGNDQADAVILAAMGSRYLGREIEVGLPIKNLEAMEGAYWPTGVNVG